jgi:hypothetical protein
MRSPIECLRRSLFRSTVGAVLVGVAADTLVLLPSIALAQSDTATTFRPHYGSVGHGGGLTSAYCGPFCPRKV